MEVTVQLELHYCTPQGTVLGDVLRLLRTRTWAAFMSRHIASRLEKVSPVDVSVLEALTREWKAEPSDLRHSVGCTICLDTDDEENRGRIRQYANLPCGHSFHRRCIQSWLELQSTCPICRWQFSKKFAGRFVVRGLRSTVVLPEYLHTWPRCQLAIAPVGGQAVRLVANVVLEKASTTSPCALRCLSAVTATLLDESSGEMVFETDTRSSASDHHFDHCVDRRHQVVSTRFAAAKESTDTKIGDVVSSHVAAEETGRKRRCIRRQVGEPRKRQRVSK